MVEKVFKSGSRLIKPPYTSDELKFVQGFCSVAGMTGGAINSLTQNPVSSVRIEQEQMNRRENTSVKSFRYPRRYPSFMRRVKF